MRSRSLMLATSITLGHTFAAPALPPTHRAPSLGRALKPIHPSLRVRGGAAPPLEAGVDGELVKSARRPSGLLPIPGCASSFKATLAVRRCKNQPRRSASSPNDTPAGVPDRREQGVRGRRDGQRRGRRAGHHVHVVRFGRVGFLRLFRRGRGDAGSARGDESRRSPRPATWIVRGHRSRRRRKEGG